MLYLLSVLEAVLVLVGCSVHCETAEASAIARKEDNSLQLQLATLATSKLLKLSVHQETL